MIFDVLNNVHDLQLSAFFPDRSKYFSSLKRVRQVPIGSRTKLKNELFF